MVPSSTETLNEMNGDNGDTAVGTVYECMRYVLIYSFIKI